MVIMVIAIMFVPTAMLPTVVVSMTVITVLLEDNTDTRPKCAFARVHLTHNTKFLVPLVSSNQRGIVGRDAGSRANQLP